MMAKLTKEDLERIKADYKGQDDNYIKVGMSTCGLAAGAGEVYNFLKEEISKENLPIHVSQCGCVGMCCAEPLIEVKIEGLPKVMYGKVDKEAAIKIFEGHIKSKKLVDNQIYIINT